MHSRHFVLLFMLAAVAVSAAAPREGAQTEAGEQFAGVWSGSWEGGGSGGFELTLTHEKGKPLTGSVSVTGEPEYKATLTSVVFDGAKMTAKYDFTPEPAAEVVLAATFTGETPTGTW